jgi:hypothetical protein
VAQEGRVTVRRCAFPDLVLRELFEDERTAVASLLRTAGQKPEAWQVVLRELLECVAVARYQARKRVPIEHALRALGVGRRTYYARLERWWRRWRRLAELQNVHHDSDGPRHLGADARRRLAA